MPTILAHQDHQAYATWCIIMPMRFSTMTHRQRSAETKWRRRKAATCANGALLASVRRLVTTEMVFPGDRVAKEDHNHDLLHSSPFYGILVVFSVGTLFREFWARNARAKLFAAEAHEERRAGLPVLEGVQLLKPNRAHYALKSRLEIRHTHSPPTKQFQPVGPTNEAACTPQTCTENQLSRDGE